MARYVLTADLTFEGLPYLRGDILNAPRLSPEVVANTASLTNVPRVRIAGLQHNFSTYYLTVPAAEQIGYQTAEGQLPPDASGDSNVIQEPVLPAANTQYD